MKQLESFSIGAPGFYGLNSQDSGVSIDPGFATVANNLVVDKYGRLAARKGWNNKTLESVRDFSAINKTTLTSVFLSYIVGNEPTDVPAGWFDDIGLDPDLPLRKRGDIEEDGGLFSDDALTINAYFASPSPLTLEQKRWLEDYMFSPILDGYIADGSFSTLVFPELVDPLPNLPGYVRFMAEHITADDTSVILASGFQNKITTGGVDNFFTSITPIGYTVTDNDWTASNLLGVSLITQRGHEPLVYDSDVSPVLQTMTNYMLNVKGVSTPQNYGTDYLKNNIAAYGRFWGFTDNTVYWSTDIADAAFPCFCEGTSGTLNIAAVLPKNVDKITGLAVHNNFLVIFCEHNIIIYQGADNPIGSSFSLSDIISGVGCTTYKSIQNVGNDLIFLSDTGLRSLGRLVTEKSLPMRELTTNVSDELLQDLADEAALYDGSLDHTCSVYSEKEGFYLLALPSLGYVYCLDMRKALPDGTAKITKWVDFPCYSLLKTRDRKILLGKYGLIGEYSGFLDNGVKYSASLLSTYNSLQTPSLLKLFKKVKAVVIGGTNQSFNIKTVLDFGDSTNNIKSIPVTISSTSAVAEYNIAEFSVGEYSGFSNDIQTMVAPASGTGSIIQIGFDVEVNNQPFSVQKIDLLYKTGRNI